jgi:hypothetical protein
MNKVNILAPAGNWESLMAAINAGANEVYFGIGELNMRAAGANNFELSDLGKIAKLCQEKNIQTWVTLNTVVYDEEIETIREVLREIKKSVFIEPTNDILEKYNLNERETFIIKPIISEAPTQNINGIETVTIEKMLVDIFCDDVIFSAQQGGEMRTIFKNAFEKYTINQSKMLRYADRRRKKEELNQFIKTISNLWQ